jgi:hypothetical protein
VEPILITIVSALVAGATAKAKDIASKAVSDAYDGLKSLLIRKLGKSGAVQSVEDDPDSKEASATLASAIAKQNLHQDPDLKDHAEQLEQAVATAREAGVPNAGNIDIDSIRGRVNATVESLVASGNIHLGAVVAETGDATIRNLSAGSGAVPKNG